MHVEQAGSVFNMAAVSAVSLKTVQGPHEVQQAFVLRMEVERDVLLTCVQNQQLGQPTFASRTEEENVVNFGDASIVRKAPRCSVFDMAEENGARLRIAINPQWEPLIIVLLVAGDGDARSLHAINLQSEQQFFAKHMEVDDVAPTPMDAINQHKGPHFSAFSMGVVDDAVLMAVQSLFMGLALCVRSILPKH